MNTEIPHPQNEVQALRFRTKHAQSSAFAPVPGCQATHQPQRQDPLHASPVKPLLHLPMCLFSLQSRVLLPAKNFLLQVVLLTKSCLLLIAVRVLTPAKNFLLQMLFRAKPYPLMIPAGLLPRAKPCVLFLPLLLTLSAPAQQVQIQMNLPPPGMLNPEDLLELASFHNVTASTLNVNMLASVEEVNKGLVFSGISSVFSLPPGFSVPDYSALEPVEVEYVDAVTENYVIQTNNLPGGEYVICITLLDAEMGLEVGYQCVSHLIFHPSAPMLVFPADGDVIYEPAPFFVWLPPSPMPPVEIFYSMRMVEVLEGQTPYEAILSNPSWFEEPRVMIGTYPYPAGAAPLEGGKTYAWQVQALLDEGFPVGENHGYSEIHLFQHRTSIVDEEGLTWMLPPEGAIPRPAYLVFEWLDPLFADGLPQNDYFYAIEMYPTSDGVEDEDEIPAVPLLFPHIHEASFTYPSHLPLLTEVPFAARVHRIRQEGYHPLADPPVLDPPALDPPGDGGPWEWTTPFEPYQMTLAEFIPPDARVSASSTLRQFSFTEATLEACCDSIAVMNKIWGDMGAIRDDLCIDKKDLMDQLLEALDDYVDKQWDADVLQGRLDAASDCKDKLQAFKDQALGGLQSEIDRLKDLNEDCSSQWESAFHERYVANPLAGGSHVVKQHRYERAVRSVQRRFDRRLQRQLNDLQGRRDRTESRYEDLAERLDAYANDTEIAHHQAQQDASDALNLVNDIFEQLRANLEGMEAKWQALFAFMMDNFCCITKCAEVQVPVPPEFAEMEDCLRDLFNRLIDWKANIREPGNHEELKNQANKVFDVDGAMDRLRELRERAAELNAAIADFNTQSQYVKLVDRACYSLHMYASGGRSPGRVHAPSDHRGTNYGVPVIPKSFVYKASGEYAPSQQVRREAARERRAFQREHAGTIGEINRLASRLGRANAENGFARREVIEAHGKAAAVPHQEQSAQKLDQLIDSMLEALHDAYDVAKHHGQRRAFNDIMTECVAFREALRELDEKYADHAGKSAEEEASLRGRLAELERLIRQLRERLLASGSTIEALEKKIAGIRQKIEELQEERVHPDLSAGKQESLRELRQRLSELERQLREARAHASDASRILDELERLRDEIGDAMKEFGDITPPSPIGSTQEANEAAGKVEQERQQKEEESRRIGELINEAGGLLNEGSEACGDASKAASDGLSAGDGLLDEIYEWLEYLRRMSEAMREHERRKRQTDCLRLLEEYRSMKDEEPGILSRIWEFFWTAKEELDEIPAGYYHDFDDFMEILDKLEEFKQRVGQALTLIRGINTDDAGLRAEALAEVLRIAEELGGEVPGFGEMITFYARAYEAAVSAIQEIAEIRRRPAKATVEQHIDRTGCRPDEWHGSSLEDLLESCWQQFLSSGPGSFWMNDWFNIFPNEKSLMEDYFKDKMAARIMECCIHELLP